MTTYIFADVTNTVVTWVDEQDRNVSQLSLVFTEVPLDEVLPSLPVPVEGQTKASLISIYQIAVKQGDQAGINLALANLLPYL